MINDCVTQTLFNTMRFQGDTEYLKLSQRFHFAISKMIDGTGTYGGFSGLVGQRAFEGWVPCSESKFSSKKDMSEATYGNWKLIPNAAWKDSIKRTMKHGRDRIAYFKHYPQEAYVLEEIMLGSKKYYLLVQSKFGWKSIDGSQDTVFFEIYDADHVVAGWMNVGTFWFKNFVKINDLYVKDEYRQQGIEVKLLQTLIDWVSVQEIPPGDFPIAYFLPVIDVCTPERKKATIELLLRMNFQVSFLKDLKQPNIEYSKILAEYTVKKT